MMKNERMTLEGQNFEVSFEMMETETGDHHIIAKTLLRGESISADDHGLGKNAALSRLRSELRKRVLKKAA